MTHFLLSHHYPEEYDRCINIKYKQKNIHLCARCLGYFSSFFIFFFSYFFIHSYLTKYEFIVLILPLFSFVDWGLTQTNIHKGSNFSRYLTGFILGIAGSRLAFLFFENQFNIIIYLTLATYIVLGSTIFLLSKLNLKNQKIL